LLADQGQQLRSIVSLANDVEPCSVQQARYALPEQRVIVCQNDALALFVHYAP
jgi:hypothetical protein